MPVRCALALLELGDHLLARAADAAQIVDLGVEAVADVAAVAHQRARLVDEAAVDVVADVRQIVERARRAIASAAPRRPRASSRDARDDGDRLLQADEIARPRACRARRARRGARDPERLFSTSRNLPRSVLRNANSSTASRRSRMRSSETSGRSSQARSRRPAIGGDRAVDLVQQRAVAAAVHRLDDFEVLERDGVDEQAVGRGLVRDRSARARGRPSACRADSEAARRRPTRQRRGVSRPNPSRPLVRN